MHAPWNSYTGGRFHEWFFHRNSNSVQIYFRSHPGSNEVITTAVLSWHAQKFVGIWWPVTELYNNVNFQLILNCDKKKSFMKWTPGHKHDYRTAMCAYVQNRFAIILQQTIQMYTLSFGKCILTIMTSWHENTFFITGPLWGVYIGHQWISPTKGQLCNTLMLSCIKEVVGRIIELSVIWEVVTLVWHHRDACMIFFF